MIHFDKQHLKGVCNTAHHLTIDSCGDYKLEYIYFPSMPEENHFRFTGRKSGTEPLIFNDSELDTIFRFIQRTYPAMKPEDWEMLKELDDAAKRAVSEAQYSHNEKTLQKEDEAIQRLVDFQKAHKLIF